MLGDSANATILVTDLVGRHLAPILEPLLGFSSISADEFIKLIPLALVALAAIKASLSIAQWFMWERVGEIVARDLRADLVKRFVFLNPFTRKAAAQETSESQLSSALTTDVRLLREYVIHFYGGLPREGLQVFFLFLTLVMLSPQQALYFLGGVAPVVVVIARLGKSLRRRAGKALKDYSELTEWLQQRLLGIETIKHYQTERLEIANMHELNESMYRRFLRAARIKAASSPLIELVAGASLTLVLYLSLERISDNQTTGAIQLSFFSTLALLTQAGGKLGKYFNANREGVAALKRLKEIDNYLKLNAKMNLSIPVEKVSLGKGDRLIAEGITVTYPQASKPALRNFSFTFEKGKIYCLCGHSGAGKSTLFGVTLGLIPTTRGKVWMEMSSVPDFPIGYMPQKVRLAPASIAENVSYPSPEYDRQKTSRALTAVGLEGFVASLDKDVDMIVGQDGQGLSGGQAQRVQLARIEYHGNPVVLVDEGTSALDPETEILVYTFLRKLADRGSIIMMIAHRASALEIADEILLMKEGELVKSGNAKQIKSSPEFAAYLGSEV